MYVANAGDDTVTVFSGVTCDAENTTGCGRRPATISVGAGPVGLLVDPSNHTVYVADAGPGFLNGGSPVNGTVSMIDSARCTASHLRRCPRTASSTVKVGADPEAVALDRRTHTVYVTTLGKAPAQNGWTVFDADTCNATRHTGCRSQGKLVGDKSGPDDSAIDEGNQTLYSANYDETISAFDLRHCDAANLAGCSTAQPGTVTPFVNFGLDHSLWVVVDRRLHSVYVSFQADAALAVVNTRKCGGSRLKGCATLHTPVAHTGADPEGIAIDPQSQTLYTADEVDNRVSVIAAVRCNAGNTRGCRHPYPAVAVRYAGPLATDNAVHTVYVTAGRNSVSMIDERACNGDHLTGCRRTPRSFRAGPYGTGVAVDAETHTVYITDNGKGPTGEVSVVDDRSCNATRHSGCARVRTLQVPGGNAVGIAIDQLTDTIYVATSVQHHPNLISVFNGATCNASESAGCGQTPAVMIVAAGTPGGAAVAVAVNEATNTLYATNNIYADPTGNAVYVFDAATCDGQDVAGCDQSPATVTVGKDPDGLAVDPATDTVYAVVHREGDYPASVAAIDGATCNGSDTSGCRQTPAMSSAGFGALFDAFDPVTQEVFTVNLQDESLSVIDGARCSAADASGCGAAPTEDAVGDYPAYLAVDPGLSTVYVASPGGVSVVPAAPLR